MNKPTQFGVRDDNGVGLDLEHLQIFVKTHEWRERE